MTHTDPARGADFDTPTGDRRRSFADLHCHTNASFDSLASPAAVVAAAARRGLTHLAITDHDRVDGALAARTAAPPGLVVIVGEEIRSADGDLLGLFLREAVRPGMPVDETIAAIHEQGGLAGIPHPFDRLRASGLASRRSVEVLERMASLVDFVEVHNARIPFAGANERAARYARDHGLPGTASSDAHTVLEVGVAYTILDGPIEDAPGFMALLRGADLVHGRASLIIRGFMPVAKAVQRIRGNRRVRPGGGTA
jgi:predicted metal-dependent phosphoesterase TrpH